MHVVLLRLFLLSVFVCHTSGLLNHDETGTPSVDAVLDSFNEIDLVLGRKITTDDLKTVILALQKDYTSRLNTLKSKFELSLRSQQNRIQYLEKKVAYQEKLITILDDGEPIFLKKQPENRQPPQINIAIDDLESLNPTQGSSLKKQELHIENVGKNAFGDHGQARREMMLIREAPTPVEVVAFYAYMSHSLPGYIATPHHVLKFDVVRTNIGNGYHPSTGIFSVPETGVYVFTWSFLNGDTDVHSVQLMINAEEWGVVNAHSSSNSWMQSTGLVVSHVNKGDDVFVKTKDQSQGEIYSGANSRTLFAGWKLNV